MHVPERHLPIEENRSLFVSGLSSVEFRSRNPSVSGNKHGKEISLILTPSSHGLPLLCHSHYLPRSFSLFEANRFLPSHESKRWNALLDRLTIHQWTNRSFNHVARLISQGHFLLRWWKFLPFGVTALIWATWTRSLSRLFFHSNEDVCCCKYAEYSQQRISRVRSLCITVEKRCSFKHSFVSFDPLHSVVKFSLF